ncbi:hypothetical protein L2E82_46876 [Cichorium intybus]|uniref:Uncharacterized protein n=1 Tax=Cichorium intybus TaxID=13427 RepID=A0ACB8YY32_CICIN|nr:hypothetical protein L2E82_46876 [Cichorium intybus]
MESFASFFDEEWESLSRMLSDDQDSGNFSGHGLLSCEQGHGSNFEIHSIVSTAMTEANHTNSSFINDHGLCYASENINPNLYHYFSQESNDNVSLPFQSSNIISLPKNGVCNHDSVDLYDENDYHSSLLAQVFSDDSMEEFLCLRQDVNIQNSADPSVPIADKHENITPAKRKIQMPEMPNAVEEKVNDEKSTENLKKKTRVSRDIKNKKKVQPKKKQKVMTTTVNDNEVEGDDNIKGGGKASIASSSSCSSEDDLNPCQDSSGGAVNSNWKTRAGRGAATDPQSLYARKRRERINERLKVLQSLVPNGTKVDISTMLEEAVQYVKFLQLQIKLLSSDDMWMFAPIAYNGMDMGLYQKLSQSRN